MLFERPILQNKKTSIVNHRIFVEKYKDIQTHLVFKTEGSP